MNQNTNNISYSLCAHKVLRRCQDTGHVRLIDTHVLRATFYFKPKYKKMHTIVVDLILKQFIFRMEIH